MVELHKADQRWIPIRERTKEEKSEEEKVTADLYRKFQAILNKLTPQKFQSLAEQALTLQIDTEERLKGVIDKIFTKVFFVFTLSFCHFVCLFISLFLSDKIFTKVFF